MTASQTAPTQPQRRALVTGSTSGIGLAIADALADNGYQLVLHGIGDESQLEQTRSQFENRHDCETPLFTTDLTRVDELDQMMHRIESELGGVDVLVNNAGIQHVSPIEDFAPERWDSVIAVNLSACFHTTRGVLPGMRQRNHGRIINIASAHGLVASPEKAAYVAAKHGLVGLTKVTALETARTGITANAICPGWVETPLVIKQIEARAKASGRSLEDERHDLVAEKHPSAEFVSPEQLAASVIWLASDAASEVRGIALPIDGGWTAR